MKDDIWVKHLIKRRKLGGEWKHREEHAFLFKANKKLIQYKRIFKNICWRKSKTLKATYVSIFMRLYHEYNLGRDNSH